MRTIETTVIVDESGQLTLRLPEGILPGCHRVVIVIDERVSVNDSVSSGEDIDAAFAEMASDTEYRAEAIQIEDEFAVAQWEAMQVTETEI